MLETHFLEADEIPLYNWEKCIKGQYSYMRRKNAVGKEYKKEDVIAFHKLYENYIEQFGLGDEVKYYLQIKKKIIRLNIKYIQTGKLIYLNQLSIEKIKLKDAEPKENSSMSISQVLIKLSNHFKTWYNKKEITLEDFKNLTLEYERECNKK